MQWHPVGGVWLALSHLPDPTPDLLAFADG